MEGMEIVLPVAMPTWNRVLAMHPYERKKLRDMLHKIVADSVNGVDQTELEALEYLQCIRPNKTRKAEIKRIKDSMKSRST